MRLEDRITRRRRRGGKRRRLVRDLSALDPTAHPREPTGRGPTLERILDHLDPVFDGELPPDAHVHGPKGVGKSAVVAALFEHLASALPARRSVIHTATRTAATPTTSFAYVDARDAPTEFALLHAALETLSKEPVPSQGVGVEALRERLTARVAHDEHAVVAVDHVGEPETVSAATAVETLSSVSPHVSVLTVGRDPRSDATEAGDDDDATDVTDAASIAVSAYERHSLVDILYELSDLGIVRRVSDSDSTDGPGRPATRPVPNFSTLAFRGLDDAER